MVHFLSRSLILLRWNDLLDYWIYRIVQLNLNSLQQMLKEKKDKKYCSIETDHIFSILIFFYESWVQIDAAFFLDQRPKGLNWIHQLSQFNKTAVLKRLQACCIRDTAIWLRSSELKQQYVGQRYAWLEHSFLQSCLLRNKYRTWSMVPK